MWIMLTRLWSLPAFAACPTVKTMPFDGETDVPPELAQLWIGTSNLNDGVPQYYPYCNAARMVVQDDAGEVLWDVESSWMPSNLALPELLAPHPYPAWSM